jgi:Helix-turn-helix domain
VLRQIQSSGFGLKGRRASAGGLRDPGRHWSSGKCPVEQTLQDGGVLDLSGKSIPTRLKADSADTCYGGAVDVKRAADLYAHGWSLRQIGAELGVSRTTVSEKLRRAGVTMRRSGLMAPCASFRARKAT